MKKLTVMCSLAILIACKETPKDNSASDQQAETVENKVDSTAELAAITNTVHNFYKWYETNAEGLFNINFVKGGKATTIDNAKFDEYFALLAKCGDLSKTFIEEEKAFYKNLEATVWKNQNADEEPITGLDYDRFVCSQDMEDYKLLTTAPVTVKNWGNEKVLVAIELKDYAIKKFELVKENGQWLISRLICE